MKRDFELARALLVEVENTPAGFGPMTFGPQGNADQPTVNEHLELMIDAGLLKGSALRSNGRIVSAVTTGLTWEGHDFLKAAAKDTLWKKAMSFAQETGVALTFDALKAILAKLALSQAGLS